MKIRKSILFDVEKISGLDQLKFHEWQWINFIIQLFSARMKRNLLSCFGDGWKQPSIEQGPRDLGQPHQSIFSPKSVPSNGDKHKPPPCIGSKNIRGSQVFSCWIWGLELMVNSPWAYKISSRRIEKAETYAILWSHSKIKASPSSPFSGHVFVFFFFHLCLLL